MKEREFLMNNNTSFVVIVNKLNKMIADLNIKISKDSQNEELKQQLEEILQHKEKLYKGTAKDLENIVFKYGDKTNG